MPARDPNVSPHLPAFSSSHASSILPSHMRNGSEAGPGSSASSNPLSSSISVTHGGIPGGVGRRGSLPSSYHPPDEHRVGAGLSRSIGKRRMGPWQSLSETGRSRTMVRQKSDDAVVIGEAHRRDRSRESDESNIANDNDNDSSHGHSSAAIRDDTARLASMSYSSNPILNASDAGEAVSLSSAAAHLDIPSSTPPSRLIKSDGSPRKRTSGYHAAPLDDSTGMPMTTSEGNSPSNIIRGPSGLSVMLERNSRPSSQHASPEAESKIGSGSSQNFIPASSQVAGATGTSGLLSAPKNSGPSRRSSGGSDNVKVGEFGHQTFEREDTESGSTRGGGGGSESEDEDATPRPAQRSLLTSSLRAQGAQYPTSEPFLTPSPSTNPRTGYSPSSNERTPLLDNNKAPPYRPLASPSTYPQRAANILQRSRDSVQDVIRGIKKTTWVDVLDMGIKQPIANIPAVILGLLLNVLDGVSYGMILFPASAVFTDFGSIGVSMFFMSCVVSQLSYTLGGSIFKGGNGSMMIEAVPFFHILVNIIAEEVGDNPAAIISTTMFSFAFSSILVGLVFMALGALRLGALIGYFPRHILVGCIGGVGFFLIETGLEVSRGLKEEGFVYDLATLKIFFESGHAVALWTIPLALAILLRVITHRYTHELIFPAYFFVIPVIFYIIIAIGGWKIAYLRELGWIFDVGQVTQPWYTFYTLFDIRHFSWTAFWACIPTQMALVFFGILHVPLNIPALGVSLSEDNVKLDRELVAHGVSNLASGFLGSVPNYLCYVNTVLFYRVGGGSRLSGVMLAGGTTIIMIVGPSAIGFLPVTVVGALIFVLGIDLTIEAVWDTRYRVNRSEYVTIWVIAIGMTIFDFVIGLLLGIILASLFFVVQNSRRRAIRAIFTGSTAKSTVRRPHIQRAFIQEVGRQTVVMKLQGFLFFGTITKVEEEIRQLIDLAAWEKNPIRFLIVDFALVSGLDFSSAESFVRIQRLLALKDVLLIFSGADPNGLVGTALRAVDLWADQEGTRLEVFDTLNDALEWTENAYLTAFYTASQSAKAGPHKIGMDFPEVVKPPFALSESFENSPRRSHLAKAGDTALAHHPRLSFGENTPQSPSKPSFVQPLPILLQTFSSYTSETHDFFFQLVRYFRPVDAKAGDIIWKQNEEPNGLFLIESGLLRATYEYEDHSELLQETMVAGTVAGELSMLSGSKRNATVVAERDCRLWKLDNESLQLLEKEKPEIARQFVKIVLKVAAEEADVLSSYMIAVLS